MRFHTFNNPNKVAEGHLAGSDATHNSMSLKQRKATEQTKKGVHKAAARKVKKSKNLIKLVHEPVVEIITVEREPTPLRTNSVTISDLTQHDTQFEKDTKSTGAPDEAAPQDMDLDLDLSRYPGAATLENMHDKERRNTLAQRPKRKRIN